jgi:tyrosyl-tRNA synthetase
LPENEFLSVFEGVPQATIKGQLIRDNISIIDFLSEATGFLSSKGDARRALKENSISINKSKVDDTYSMSTADLIGGKYILAQRGKKNYFLAEVK